MATLALLRPAGIDDLRDAIADAAHTGTRLALRGGGSKDGIGADSDARLLDMRGFTGAIEYDPAELVLTAGAGTPLAEVEAVVAAHGQELAFDPLDPGPIFGRSAGAATLGGTIAAGLSGSRRLAHGAVRDHLLGFAAVSGRGEPFIAGGKVVKNVTGFDLSKVVTGSWGRIAALTEVTIKVMPRPRESITVVLAGLAADRAVAAMAAALGSPAEVSAAAHLPDGEPRTMLLVRGFGLSVAARAEMLENLLAPFGRAGRMAPGSADAAWASLATLDGLATDRRLWRVVINPGAVPTLLARLAPIDSDWRIDWAGGIVWLVDDDADAVRAAATAAGGHATLMRSPKGRESLPALHPQLSGVAALEERVRRAFDPSSVFETGRF